MYYFSLYFTVFNYFVFKLINMFLLPLESKVEFKIACLVPLKTLKFLYNLFIYCIM